MFENFLTDGKKVEAIEIMGVPLTNFENTMDDQVSRRIRTTIKLLLTIGIRQLRFWETY